MKLRHQALSIDASLKKKDKWKTLEEDLTDEWIDSHEEENKLKDIEKAKKKFEKVSTHETFLIPSLSSSSTEGKRAADLFLLSFQRRETRRRKPTGTKSTDPTFSATTSK